MTRATIEALPANAFPAARDALTDILHACVHAGASVGFVLPFPLERAGAFWDTVAASAADGQRHVLVARLDDRIVGTVQLVFAQQDNGRHRAEIAKLLVHPDARRRGIAQALMQAAEAVAHQRNLRLLVLDTGTDAAEALYRRLGFALTGVVPNYAADVDGGFVASRFMHKELPADAG
ncbi:MAG: GNAT family N-acetyltransferase [Acetobacteraceae bacterium]|nr:GNAT family N-acetyltransferase [Acetobacteraceae bacterium]